MFLEEFCVLSGRLAEDATVRPEDVCCAETVVTDVRFDAARTVSGVSANVA